MSDHWFKFYADQYLADAKIDQLPDAAEKLLIRMWCVCNISGDASCPSDPEEIARLTKCKSQYVSQYVSHCEPFFELHGDRYVSPRMEREKRYSDAGKIGAANRWKDHTYSNRNANRKPNRNANANANRNGIRIKNIRIEESPISLPENSDQIVEEIINAHPKPEHSRVVQDYVIDALIWCQKHDKPDGWLLERTKAYAEAMKGKEAKAKGCAAFFEGRVYDWPADRWEWKDESKKPVDDKPSPYANWKLDPEMEAKRKLFRERQDAEELAKQQRRAAEQQRRRAAQA